MLDNMVKARISQLIDMDAGQWPLGRILALGGDMAACERLKALQPDPLAALNLNILWSDARAEGECAFLARLDQPRWDAELAFCSAIARVSDAHGRARMIASARLHGTPDAEICQTYGMTSAELKRVYNDYVSDVKGMLRAHEAAMDFLYHNDIFDSKLARVFFGLASLQRLEYCCDMQAMHTNRSGKGRRAMGVQAAQSKEADNTRTRVLDDWEHLKRYIEEQFDIQPFLGAIELADSEYQMLLDNVKPYVRYLAQADGMTKYDKVFCVALVQIALRCSTAAYWPEVEKALGLKSESETALGQRFLDTIKRYHKGGFVTSKYVASIKLHTFVSDAYIGDLFDFLFAYYELDLGRNMAFADLKTLRECMVGGGYFSRRSLLLQQTLDALKMIPEPSLQRMRTYLNWIDRAFWSRNWSPDRDDRFSRAFKAWRDAKPEFNGSWETRMTGGRRGKRMFTSPTLNLNRQTGAIDVILPSQKLPFDVGDSASWRVFAGDQLLYEVPREVIESVISCRTEETACALPWEKLLDEIRIELRAGDGKVRSYLIPADCVRVFGAQGALVSGRRIPAGAMTFFTRPGEEVLTESQPLWQPYGPWMVGEVTLAEGEIVIFPDSTLAIAGADAAEGLIGGRTLGGARVLAPGQAAPLSVCREWPSYLLRLTPEQFDKTRVQVNDTFLAASELPYRRVEVGERGAEDAYLLSIPAPTEPVGVYHVNINAPEDRHARDYTFCYWKDLGYEFDNGESGLPYWAEPRGSVRLDTDVTFAGQGLKRFENSNEYGFELDPGHMSLDLKAMDKDITLRLDVSQISWRGEGEWSFYPLGEVWQKDVPDRIEVLTPGREVWFYAGRDGMQNGQCRRFERRADEDVIHVNLGELRDRWFTRDRVSHELYMSVQGKVISFATVYCKSYLVSGRLEADYVHDALHGQFDIIGQGAYAATILRGGEEVVSLSPLEDGRLTAQAELPSGTYTAVVYEVIEDDEFGFGTKYDEIGRRDVELINPTDLSGARLSVISVDTVNEADQPLPLKKGFSVMLQRRVKSEGVCYEGMATDTSGASETMYPVRVLFPNPEALDHCGILFDDDGEWGSLLYDYGHQRIVREESRKLPRRERYRRYTLLDLEDTFTVEFGAKA